MLWTWAAILVTFFGSSSAEDLFGPKYKPTKGAIWPKPVQQISEATYYKYVEDKLAVVAIGHSCDILTKAVDRYTDIVKDAHSLAVSLSRKRGQQQGSEAVDINYQGNLEQLQVDLKAPCETYPYFGMDENYELTISKVSQLRSRSIWGILRGLESWSQLFYFTDGDTDLRINKTQISDSPFYPHRGLLVDTARHYISLSNILLTLDAMAMNKLNVFHWHIVDDQSFPYQSEKFPELSARGAYHSSLVYSRADVQTVVQHARDRGIRVLPEFDVPGHTRSWGQSHPEVLTECYEAGAVSGLGPMNPASNQTYALLRELLQEVQEYFPDTYTHLGGDEVDLHCWSSNPDLQKFMRDNGMTSVDKLHNLFMSNVIPLLGQKTKPIVWQEVFDEGVQLSDQTLVHVWKTNNFHYITVAGYKVIYSTGWYLDHLNTGGDWERLYQVDLQQLSANSSAVVGGEACMWAEVVDDTNIMSRVWPRASAVAEKLWTPPVRSRVDFPPLTVFSRIEEHACRMNRRGIPAQPPNGPSVCLRSL